MRIAARQHFTNPLPWPDDEARGELVPILEELTRGTSHWDATAVRIVGEADWEICFKYAFPPDYSPSGEWCTTANDPQPPPPIGPGPAPPGWPDEYGDEVTMFVEPFAGPSCWQSEPVDDVALDASIGPWGGWGAVFEGGGVGDMYLEVYPIAWDVGVVTWRFRWEVFLGSFGQRDAEFAAGFLPAVLLEPGEVVDCPDAQLAMSVYILI